jgi:hypothetical protein
MSTRIRDRGYLDQQKYGRKLEREVYGQSPKSQNYDAWFVDYPMSHRLAGKSVEVVPRALLDELLSNARNRP